jgi:YHS domain-containing protein
MLRLLAYLFDLIVVYVVARLLRRTFWQLFGTAQNPSAGSASRPGAGPRSARETSGGEMARDPICGMFVSTELSHRLNDRGQTLHFCSQECLARYQKAGVKP